mmetsp:Transcript_12832/g.40481  ORF Transcript_12832/g.40481 Transcript_12832/m.40481 type:complete len:420 (-) Transcript_12832:136-1395(-)
MSTSEDMLVVLGAGSNGIEEMQEHLDDTAVQWALIRFELGSGAFCRKKFVFLHFNGEECSAVRRGQANAYTAEAQRLLRADNQEGFHASISMTRKHDVTYEQLLERIGHFFVKDDIDYNLKLERERSTRVDQKVPRKSSAKPEAPDLEARPAPAIPGHQSSKYFKTGRDALQSVAEPFGRWNWVLVRPDPEALELAEGGTGSVDEMREHLALHEQEGLSGLLRLGFGAGRLRRTKHVFVHCVSEKVPVVNRGRAAAARPQMQAKFGKLVHCSVSMELAQAEDLTLEDVIERVRRSAIVDDQVLEPDSPTKSAYSVEAFRDALKEERLAAVPTPPAQPVTRCSLNVQEKQVADVVRLVHAADGPLNWALFGPNLPRLRSKSGALKGPAPAVPPAACSTTTLPAGGWAAQRLVKTRHTTTF